MKGAHASEFRRYWMRYVVAFWAGDALRFARDNILVACVCSIAPGLIAAGVGAALSDDKWRVAIYATLLTYASLFVLFLTWRLACTPFELDRERQQFIIGLSKRLAYTRSKLAALQARPPAMEAEILEIHVQAETTPTSRILNFCVDCNIFLRVKLRLREIRTIEVLKYELSAVLPGDSLHADRLDDIQDWGLVIERKPIGIGTKFRFIVSKLTPLVRKLDRAGVPVEGWLHFHVKGVLERELGATVFRLNVITPTGSVSTDMRGDKELAEGKFQKIAYVSRGEIPSWQSEFASGLLLVCTTLGQLSLLPRRGTLMVNNSSDRLSCIKRICASSILLDRAITWVYLRGQNSDF